MKTLVMSLLLVVACAGIGFSGQRSLTLEESKQLALKNNISIQNSGLSREAAEQVRKAAFTKYFPTISANGMKFEAEKGMFEMTTTGGNLPVYDGNLDNLHNATQYAYFPGMSLSMFKSGTIGMVTAVQPVFAGGRIYHGNKLASLGEQVTTYQVQLAENEVLQKTEDQYWLVVSLEEKMNTIQRYEELLTSLERQVEDAYKSGIVMKNDVLKVQLKKSEVLLNRSKLENGKKLATMAFCQHIGLPYDTTIALTDKLSSMEPPDGLFVDDSVALSSRAEYKLLQASVDAEKLQTWIKLGEYLPQAGIGVGGLYMKFDDSKEQKVGMIFGTVSIPISGWWEASHSLEERSVKERIAENNFKDNSELLTLQIEKAWQDVTDAYKQVLLSEDAKRQAEENAKVNQDSYTNGIVTVSDLLEAQAMLQQANDQLTDAKANYRSKQITYLHVTGR